MKNPLFGDSQKLKHKGGGYGHRNDADHSVPGCAKEAVDSSRLTEKPDVQKDSGTPGDHHIIHHQNVDKKQFGDLGIDAPEVNGQGDDCHEKVPGPNVFSQKVAVTAHQKFGCHVQSHQKSHKPGRVAKAVLKGIVGEKMVGKQFDQVAGGSQQTGRRKHGHISFHSTMSRVWRNR